MKISLKISLAITKANHYIDISTPAAPLLSKRNSVGFFYLGVYGKIY